MTRFVVEIEGRICTVTLDAGTASVNGASPVRVHLEDVEGTPVRIDGRRYLVDALDERTRAIRDMADASRPPAGPVPLQAPMPGLIVRVHVSVGDTVVAGQSLVSIEAMKMENELRASADGTVKGVLAMPGRAVEKGATLIEFAPDP
jgi:biotin carboxyl carrier protein